MSRIPVIAGNWKMYGTPDETRKLLSKLQSKLTLDPEPREVIVFPPFPSLPTAAAEIHGGTIQLGAQNVHWESKGAFTGEISANMLLAVGCKWVIVGHSERRQLFGETDETVNQRTLAALSFGLKTIVCVGETLEEHESGRTLEVVGRQTRAALLNINTAAIEAVCIAYEPVWAIGTGKTATPDQAQKVHAAIRSIVAEMIDEPAARAIRILYGGSVKPENVDTLMAELDIDGALVGGASLDAESFARIVGFQEN